MIVGTATRLRLLSTEKPEEMRYTEVERGYFSCADLGVMFCSYATGQFDRHQIRNFARLENTSSLNSDCRLCFVRTSIALFLASMYAIYHYSA